MEDYTDYIVSDLVEQIQIEDYQDEYGGNVLDNLAFVKLVELANMYEGLCK